MFYSTFLFSKTVKSNITLCEVSQFQRVSVVACEKGNSHLHQLCSLKIISVPSQCCRWRQRATCMNKPFKREEHKQCFYSNSVLSFWLLISPRMILVTVIHFLKERTNHKVTSTPSISSVIPLICKEHKDQDHKLTQSVGAVAF